MVAVPPGVGLSSSQVSEPVDSCHSSAREKNTAELARLKFPQFAFGV